MIVRRLGRAVLDASRPRPAWRPRLSSRPASSPLHSPITPVPLFRRTITTSTSLDPTAPAIPLDTSSNPHASAPAATSIQSQPTIQPSPVPSPYILSTLRARVPPPPPVDASPAPLPDSVRSLLPALRLQTPHYATIHVHARPYLVQAGDRVRLPFRMPGVEVGDVLRLTRASVLGSRDFTLRGSPWVDDRCFTCRATVVGVEAEPMRVMEKTKRRNRRVKKVASKHRYTEFVVSELTVRSDEAIAQGVE